MIGEKEMFALTILHKALDGLNITAEEKVELVDKFILTIREQGEQ